MVTQTIQMIISRSEHCDFPLEAAKNRSLKSQVDQILKNKLE